MITPEYLHNGRSSTSWWGATQWLSPPCHTYVSQKGRTSKIVLSGSTANPLERLELPSVGSVRPVLLTRAVSASPGLAGLGTPAGPAAAAPHSVAAAATDPTDSYCVGQLVTLVPPERLEHQSGSCKGLQVFCSGSRCCYYCGYPREGRTVCLSYQAWWLGNPQLEWRIPSVDFRAAHEKLPVAESCVAERLQQYLEQEPAAAASLLVAVIGDASLGMGLNAALQCMLPGEEVLLLVDARTVPSDLLLQGTSAKNSCKPAAAEPAAVRLAEKTAAVIPATAAPGTRWEAEATASAISAAALPGTADAIRALATASVATEAADMVHLLLRLRLHYQTSMKPLYVPLPLYRSLYRRLLFPPAPKRQRRPSPAEEAATAAFGTAAPGGGEPRCCCCSSEEAFSGADDPDSDACSTRNMSSSCTSEINSRNASSDRRPSISNNTCSICRERQRARANRTSKNIISTPCAFFAQQTGLGGGPSGGPSGGSWCDPGSVSCGSLPEDLWEVTLQFSLCLQDGTPLSFPSATAGLRASKRSPMREPLATSDNHPVFTYKYTLGEGKPLCPAVDVFVRSPLVQGPPVDLWVGPLWGCGSLEGISHFRSPVSSSSRDSGDHARAIFSALASPLLLGKPLYFKGLSVVSASPPQTGSCSSSSRLLQSQVLRKEANEKLEKGQTHAALRLYQRAIAALGRPPYEEPTELWAFKALTLNKTLALLRLRRWEEALTCSDEVLSLSSSSSKGTYRKAKALGGLRRYAEAEELCLQAHQRLTAGKASKSPAASEAAAFRRLHEKLVRERTIWEQQQEQKIEQQQQHQHKMQQLPQRDKTAKDISRNYAKEEQKD